ncbi:MAG: hypothetical protein M3426_03395 [Actinomycetota bacterium]|nr:hypothetical protein [Actinomycetota bacterium]
MDKDVYYIVTQGGAPAVEEVPEGAGKAAVVCERPDLADEGETLEPVPFDDLAFLLEARADIEYVRVRTPEGLRTVSKPHFLGEAFS